MTEKTRERKLPAEQEGYARRVAELAPSVYGRTPKACVITFGCQQNVSDSERMKGLLATMGYTLIENFEEADFILFNTCAVREHAEDRVFGNIGRTKAVKQERPRTVVAVCGCMAQRQSVAEIIKKSYPYVDLVFGTQVQHRLPEFLYHRLSGGNRLFELTLDNAEIVEGVPIRRDGSIKGWLPIMYGCDNFCTYCIVPYVRGRERSREPQAVITEAKEMIAAGFKEITLLGQNVNSYGKGLSEPINFAELLRRICALEGEFRIHFMTSHPKDCTKELIDVIRDNPKVSRHLHLPFQSGSDRILKRMNRHYTKAQYLELIRYAKEQIPDAAFTSDIIVGFPGETYEDFKETLSLVEEVRFSSLFTFIYSPREGTPAAAMPAGISRAEKGKWFDELLKTQEKIANEDILHHVGKTYRVLCVSKGSKDGTLLGHTNGTAVVEFEGEETLIGSFVTVTVDGYDGVLTGKRTEKG